MSPDKAVGPNVTELLHAWNSGNTDVADALLPLIYDELHRRAAAYMRHERRNHTLQPTALVHEAYLKLIGQRNDNWNDRQHFFAIASQVMRRILVDHADEKQTETRRITTGPATGRGTSGRSGRANVDLLALDEAMARLAKFDPQQERLVELRYFGGMSLEEAAAALGISRARRRATGRWPKRGCIGK